VTINHIAIYDQLKHIYV